MRFARRLPRRPAPTSASTAIDPRGLTDGSDDAIAIGDFANNTNPNAGIGLNSLRNELFLAQQTLRQLSEETGGFAIVNRNNVRLVLRPHRRGQQLVLPAGVLPAGRQAGRSLPPDRGQDHQARAHGPRPPRLHDGTAPPGDAARRHHAAAALRRDQQPDTGERGHVADLRGALQGDGTECVGARRDRDGRPRPDARRQCEGRRSRSWRSTSTARPSAVPPTR